MNATESFDKLRALKGLIVDMDGVLWHGDQPLPGFHEFFQALRQRGTRFVLATNNNTQTPEGFAQKCARLGVEVSPDEVVNATIATIHYLKQHYPPGTRLYVIGELPLKNLLAGAGYTLADENVAAVVAAMDRNLNYEMIKRATLLIRAGADFIGPNPDKSYPTPEGIVPGSGMVLAAIEASSDRRPIIMGKPETPIFEIALDRMGLRRDEAASVGDRLDTDIAGGLRAGLTAVLMLSGITRREDLQSSPVKPTWIFENLLEMVQALEG